MKRLYVYIILIGILMTACNAAQHSQMPEGQNFVRLQTEETIDNDGIKVIRAKKELKPGDRGEITIQGKARKVYNITSTYNVDNRTLTANQRKAAGNDGTVTWTWNVDKKTRPGTYPITITGDGTTLLSSYKVIK